MFIIQYVFLIGAALMMLTYMGVSASFAKFSWCYYKRDKDYMFVFLSLVLFGIFLMSLAMFALIIFQLLTGAV